MQSNKSTRGSPKPARRGANEPEIAFEGFVDDYLPALLAQASHLISSEFHKVVRRQHLSVSEWRVLATLASLEVGQTYATGQLARITLNKQPTLTRLLDRMATMGHIERQSDASDRRITLVQISKSGRQLVELLIVLAREHERRVLEPFGQEAGAQLKQVLRRMIDMHQDGEPEPAEDD